MKNYYPYPANDGKHKYYIITKSGRKILFGAVGYCDFTKHKDAINGTLIDIEIMSIGESLEIIVLGFGLVGYYK
jgi:hypothetical protein